MNAAPNYPASPAGNTPAMALATLVAALHLSIWVGRLGERAGLTRPAVATWRLPAGASLVERGDGKAHSARPKRTYSAGQLALDTGVAVLALAAWLLVMRSNGSHGR